jgi:RNA polymerase sigma-70 factor (ECF subfamily)
VQPESESEAVIEESCLLAQSAAGDREAFRLLYARYGARLYSLAVRIVGNTSEAEELVQDAFVKIWRSAGSYDPRKSRPFTWAVTIMRRTCFDHLRKRRRLPLMAFPNADEGGVPGAADVGNARQSAEAREDSERLSGALAEIPQNQRRALELALFSAMSHAEIAQVLEQPVGTVKSWIRRGLLDLRSTLNDTQL